MVRIFPLIFILLWSSAFITTKPIIDNSDPFSALAFRFFFVAIGFFLFSVYSSLSIFISRRNLIESVLSGVLFHGLYLGGVFYSISIGMPTGIAALIVTLQPVLTNALSGPILGEKVTVKQWSGVFLGFVGAAIVLGLDVGSEIPLFGLIATIIALIAITTSTIWQKKLSNNLPLPVSNFYQAIGGCLFHILIIIWKIKPPKAWFILLTDKGKLLLNFFCQIVDVVIAIKAITVATNPVVGISVPISKPKTITAPVKPKRTPIHCFIDTFSFKIGPLSAFVSMGWSVTISAAIPVGIPFEIEKKTPPK